jgi:hypothetical protein
MQPGQIENVRLSILRYCAAAARYGLTEGLLLQFLRSEGQRGATPVIVQAEIDYLAGKKLIEQIEKLISPEIPAWRITSAGRDFLAMNSTTE